MSQNHQYQHQNQPHTPTPANGQHTPQMALPQNGIAPGQDLSALQGVTPQQLALIVNLIQTGQLPMPPPLPAQATAPVNTAATPAVAPPDPRLTIASSSYLHNAHEQDADMDREEGELEEGEVGDTPTPRDFLRTPPKGPRNRSRSPRPPVSNAHGTKHASKRSSQPRPTIPPRKTSAMSAADSYPQTNGKLPARATPSKDAPAKSFVMEMHKAGYTFGDLSKSVGNVNALRRLYDQLGLPVSTPIDPTPAARVPPLDNQDQRKTSLTKRASVAKAPPAKDRSEYLAKLQAAKTKKAEEPATSATPPQEVPLPIASPASSNEPVRAQAQTLTQPQAKASASAKAPMAPDKRELLQQRIETLRAQQAAKQKAAALSNGGSVADPIDIVSQQSTPVAHIHGLGDGLIEAAARAATEIGSGAAPVSSPHSQPQRQPISIATGSAPASSPRSPAPQSSVSPMLNRGFGLPGLFTTMAAAAQQQQPRSASALPSSHIPLEEQQRQGPPASSPYPLGRNSNAFAAPPPQPLVSTASGSNERTLQGKQADEPFVIVDSDDESDNDIEVTETGPDSVPMAQGISLPNRANTGFSGNLDSSNNGRSSTPATPGTPSAAYKRKLEELEEAKRKLAEAQKRQKTVQQTRTNQNLPGLASGDSASEVGTPGAAANTIPVSSDAPNISLSRQQELEALRLRLEIAERQVKEKQQRHGAIVSDPAPPTSVSSPADDVQLSTMAPQNARDESALSDESGDLDDSSAEEGELHEMDTSLDFPNRVDHNATGDNTLARLGGDLTGSLPANALTDEIQVDATDQSRVGQDHRSSTSSQQAGVSTTQQIVNTIPEEEGEIEDDDDLDDIYAEPAPPQHPNPLPAPIGSAVTFSSDDDDDENDDDDDDDEVPQEMEAVEAADNDVDGEEDDNITTDDDADDAMDMDSSDEEDSVDEEDLAESLPSPAPQTASPSEDQISYAPATTEMSNIAVDDDLAPELQPSEEELAVPQDEPTKQHRFQPYESPLSRFKDYRYHPSFLQTVPGGFKSLTYSHKIDPMVTICPFELAGGSCHDKACVHQHFQAMRLTDNELLKSMGADNIPAAGAEEDQRWKTGLSEVVQELRNSNQIKVGAIARRIAEYRREFRGDPTKTLLLD